MFNGYNETPLISYNEFDQNREKKGENVSKWSFMHEPGAQPTANNCQAEFWSGKPNFLGIPHISKCNCSSCYPSTESQSYQGESPRHRPWLPRSFPVPFNGSSEICKLPGCHQWENVGVPNQSFPDSNVQYLHQAEGTHPFYRHYANSMLSELNQRGVITSVKDSDLTKQKQKVEGQNGTRQPGFCDAGYNFPKNLEKRIDSRNFCDSNEKYSNVDPYRHSYSVDQHMSRLPVVEPHIKAVPSNLSENRVPSTGHRNVKKNAAQSSIDQEYSDPKKVVFSEANLDKNPRAAYQSAMGKEGPAPENFLFPSQKTVDFKNTGIIDHRSYNLHEEETQKLLLENYRHADFSRNMSDVIKRNNHTPVIDGRKDCAMGQSPASKYLDLENGKNSCGVFYQKEFNGDKLTRAEPDPSCFQRSGDLIKNENCIPRSTLIFNDRFPEKVQNAFAYQNNPSDFRNYLRPDYPYQGYGTQGLYDYSAVPQFQRNEMNQYGLRQQQQQLPICVVDQFMQNNNIIYNSPYQQPQNSDKIPQQFYPEKPQINSSNPQIHQEEIRKNNYLETIRTKEMNKNVNSKISPLRLLRKKKFVSQRVAEPMPVANTTNAAPALDVRKFWSTWAEEEEENVAPTQMVVLDCQNIDPEQAKLLHLCESDPLRAVHLQGDSIVALKNSDPTDQFVHEVKNSEQMTVVKDSLIGNQERVIEQEQIPVSRKPIQSVQREVVAEPNNNNQQSVVRPQIAETASQKVLSDNSVKIDQKPCKRGRSTSSQESKDTIRHKKPDVEKEGEKTNRLDKWTEKKFDFLKRAEESRAAEILRHEEEKKKIFEKRLTFQQGTHNELKQNKVQSPEEERKPLGPKINEKIPEWLSPLDDNSQSTSPTVSDADLPDLPTSEYRRNKFLDYSDRKVIVGQFQNESSCVKDSDCHVKDMGDSTHNSSSEVEEIKKEQAIKLEPPNTTWLLGSDKLGKNESDSFLIDSIKLNDGTGFEMEDMMKKISKINVESPEINFDEFKAVHKPEEVRRNKKPKKIKKLERKEESEERTDKLTVENISVSKPTIKFSIQKSHDLKISFKVLNSSSKKYENLDEEIGMKQVERTENPDDGAKNSTELITLRLKSIQRDAPNTDRSHRQNKNRDGDSKENKRRFRRNKIPVDKNPVLKIKKNRYTLQEKEKEPVGADSHHDDTLNLFGKNADDFQVQETVDSAKIKLTFKRHKANYETEYRINKKCVGKMLEEEALDPGAAQYFNHWETDKKKSRRRKDSEMLSQASVESFSTDQAAAETGSVMSDNDSGSDSISKEGQSESIPEEESRKFELHTEEKTCVLGPEKLTFPASSEIPSDTQFMVSLPEEKDDRKCDDEGSIPDTNCNDKGKECEEEEDSKTLKKDEDFSFDASEMERSLEEEGHEEISLDFNGDISTKENVGSVNENEVKSMMFSTNETNHSESDSSYKSNSNKDVDETWITEAATENGNNNDISKNDLESNFLIPDEDDPDDCDRSGNDPDENNKTNVNVELNSREECESENTLIDVAFGDEIDSGELNETVNEPGEQEEIENQNSLALSEDLNPVNIVKTYGESEEVKSEVATEQPEVLIPSEPTCGVTSSPESFLVTPVLLSPISQTFESAECAEVLEKPLEDSQEVLLDNPIEIDESDILLNQVECDTKPGTQLEEKEIVDDTSEEENERIVENQDVRADIPTEITNQEESKPPKFSSSFKLENPRKITRTNSLLLEIEHIKESQKRRKYKAKSCPPSLSFRESETPLMDISVEDIPLPPGDPPPGNCFDLINYFKKAELEAKKKSEESQLPQSQTSRGISSSDFQPPIEHSNFQNCLNPLQPEPEDTQKYLPLKTFKIKFSLSKRKSFKFVKSKIEDEDFDWMKNKKTKKVIEENKRDLMQPVTSLDRLYMNEETHETNLKEEKTKEIHKPDEGEQKTKEIHKPDVREEKTKEVQTLDVKEEKTKEVHKPDIREEEMKEVHKPDIREEKVKEVHKPDIREEKMKEVHKPDMREEKMKEVHKPDVREEKTKEVHKPDVRKEKMKEMHKTNVREEKAKEVLHKNNVRENKAKEIHKTNVRDEKTKAVHKNKVREERAKEVHKTNVREEKKETPVMQTSLTTLGFKSVVEETIASEPLPFLSENDIGVITEKDIKEVNAGNSEHIQESENAKTESGDFQLELTNINFLGPPIELTTEDVEFEEVDLKTVEMMDEPISGNFENSNSIREEFYECEDIPTSEDLPNGDGDMEVEKVSDDDKFRNIMQNCLDNAKKFLNVGNLKLFSCSVDDLLELDCQTHDSNLSENEPDKSTNHFSRDVLLTSCEETVTDDLGLSGNFQPTDMSMDFVPSFGLDAPHNLCPEILPVDNWPYLEEEVPASPTKSKSEETDLIPIEGSETVCRKSDGLTHKSEDQREVPSSSHKNDVRGDVLNRDKTKRVFPADRRNIKRFRKSLISEVNTLRKFPTIPRRNTIESFARELLSYEKRDLKKEVMKPKNCIDKTENFWENNGTLKCRLSMEKMSNRNLHETAKSAEDGLPDDKNLGKLTEVCKKTPSWQPKVVLSRIPVRDKSSSAAGEKISPGKTPEDLTGDSVVKHAIKRQNPDFSDSENIDEKLRLSDGKSDGLDHNANENRKKIVQTGFLGDESTLKNFELSDERGIDSIKGSSLVPEASKRKKSRFRNLHTKERSGHDLKITKDPFAQSIVPEISAVVDEESVLSELLKDCHSSKVTTVSDFQAKSTKDVDEKTKRKSSENRNPVHEKKRKSSTSGGPPDRIKDKIASKFSSPCDKTKTQRTSEESKHRKSDEEKYQSSHKHRKEKSDSRSNYKHHSKHDRHRNETGSERKERLPERKGHSEDSWRKNSGKGKEFNSEEKEKPGSVEPRPVDPWVCQVCGFNDASERIAHIKSHPFHCQSCHLAFETETYFVSHLTKKHKDIRNQHHCLLCELSFDTEKQYQKHLETREHTHLESVEKNTINTLFTLLTGQACPVLGLVEMKPEWLPNQPGTVHFYHQATPLSLALQYLKMHHDLTSYSTVSSAHPN